MAGSIDAMKILGSLLGGQGGTSSSAGSILGNLMKGALAGGGSGMSSTASAGGGDLLGGLLQMAMQQIGQPQPGSHQQPAPAPGGQFKPDFGLTAGDSPAIEPEDANDQALILIKAMISAAKSDGRVDQQEIDNIVKQLGDVSEAEKRFVNEELSKPLDVNELIGDIPKGQEANAYAISLLAINLDTNPEAKYLHQLAQGLGISPQAANQIHDKLGAPKIYT